MNTREVYFEGIYIYALQHFCTSRNNDYKVERNNNGSNIREAEEILPFG